MKRLTLTEITSALGVPKSSVWLMLQHLTERRFLRLIEATKQYEIGPEYISLALKIANTANSLTLIAHPFLVDVSAATQCDIYLGTVFGNQLTYVDKVEGSQSIRVAVGVGFPRPIHCTAAGLVHLAYASNTFVDGALAGHLEKVTNLSVTNASSIRKELARIRKVGYAITNGSAIEGVKAIAVPILNRKHQIVATISSSGSSAMMANVDLQILEALRTARWGLEELVAEHESPVWEA